MSENKKQWLSLPLQFFSEGEGDSNPEPVGSVEGEEPSTGSLEADYETRLQAEIEKINTQHQAELETARSEAEKLAKMSADEKAKFEFEQRENKLTEKEQAIAARELRSETLNVLSEKSLPHEIIDIVLADDADKTSKNIEAFKSVFDKAVQASVEERLKGTSPQVGNGTAGKGTEEQVREQFAKALGGLN